MTFRHYCIQAAGFVHHHRHECEETLWQPVPGSGSGDWRQNPEKRARHCRWQAICAGGCLRQAQTGQSFILGFGGGVVCDIAGMVASVYMRGVRHAFVSTTLLSQVDASTGGKTGVNLGALQEYHRYFQAA
ncbi:MAG: hypothetical protein MZV63_61990 [Marinilabiliales bacterium]|nr:hypothetical protein [Marinilabiliales bacterium]